MLQKDVNLIMVLMTLDTRTDRWGRRQPAPFVFISKRKHIGGQ